MGLPQVKRLSVVMFLLLRFESSLNRWNVSSPHWKSSPFSATKCCRSVRRPLPDGLYWKYTIRGFLDGSTDLIEPCASWNVFFCTHLLAHILKLHVILTSRLILPTNYSDSSISIACIPVKLIRFEMIYWSKCSIVTIFI